MGIGNLLAYWMLTGIAGGYVVSKFMRANRVEENPGDVVWIDELRHLNRE